MNIEILKFNLSKQPQRSDMIMLAIKLSVVSKLIMRYSWYYVFSKVFPNRNHFWSTLYNSFYHARSNFLWKGGLQYRDQFTLEMVLMQSWIWSRSSVWLQNQLIKANQLILERFFVQMNNDQSFCKWNNSSKENWNSIYSLIRRYQRYDQDAKKKKTKSGKEKTFMIIGS